MKKQCTWITLLPEFISGREGDEDGDQGDSTDESGNDESDPKDGTGSAPKGDKEPTDEKGEDVKGLKTALDRERANVKARDKELAKLRKANEEADLAKKDEAEQDRIRREKAEEKATKMAAGMVTRDINAAIRKEAEALGFIDTDDAVSGVDLSTIPFEQDEDDPADITLDTKAIKAAVKAIATKKPHFLKSGTDDGEPTGGQFGRKGKKSTDEDAIRSKYSALQN